MKRSHTFIATALALGYLLVTTLPLHVQAREGAQGASGAFRVNNLYDYEVINQNNETVGTIADFVVSPQGYIKYVLLTPASSWGSTDRLYAVPWTSLAPHRDKGALLLDMNQERLRNAPSFARNDWPSLANAKWEAAIQRYYGQQPMEQQAMRRMAGRAQHQGPGAMSEAAVWFDFGEARLGPDARAKLDQLVAQLKNTDFAAIHLTGHADRIGPDEANFELARRRATRVAAYLAQQGIEPTKIRLLSLGEEVSTAAGQEGRRLARERRVDIAVLPTRMTSATRMEGSNPGRQENASTRQPAGRPGSRASALLSATVLEVDRENGTITVTTEYGDSVELQANNALLGRLMEGDSVEVRLRKLEPMPQRSRAGQPEDTSEQQAR